MLAVDVAFARAGFSLAVDFQVGEGECVALVGPSGAGKSTLLRIVAGLLRVESGGTISLGDQRWLEPGSSRAVPAEHRRIGFVFQEYALFPTMSAWRNVAYGIGGRRSERRRLALEALDRFGLADRADARPGELSGGQRQRVALARALAPEPRLLLLDEPLSALDSRTRASASRELAAVLDAADAPALIVTHDFAEAALISDRVIVIEDGRVVQQGSAAALAAAPASGLVADLTGAVVLRGFAREGPDGLTRVELEGGGVLLSTDEGRGQVAASIFPWEIAIEAPGATAEGSVLNHLAAEVTTVTEFGNRARVGLLAPQPIAAEVTSASIARLGLQPGSEVVVSWKATATRLTPL